MLDSFFKKINDIFYDGKPYVRAPSREYLVDMLHKERKKYESQCVLADKFAQEIEQLKRDKQELESQFKRLKYAYDGACLKSGTQLDAMMDIDDAVYAALTKARIVHRPRQGESQ